MAGKYAVTAVIGKITDAQMSEIIKETTKLKNRKVPNARASIVWTKEDEIYESRKLIR